MQALSAPTKTLLTTLVRTSQRLQSSRRIERASRHLRCVSVVHTRFTHMPPLQEPPHYF